MKCRLSACKQHSGTLLLSTRQISENGAAARISLAKNAASTFPAALLASACTQRDMGFTSLLAENTGPCCWHASPGCLPGFNQPGSHCQPAHQAHALFTLLKLGKIPKRKGNPNHKTTKTSNIKCACSACGLTSSPDCILLACRSGCHAVKYVMPEAAACEYSGEGITVHSVFLISTLSCARTAKRLSASRGTLCSTLLQLKVACPANAVVLQMMPDWRNDLSTHRDAESHSFAEHQVLQPCN